MPGVLKTRSIPLWAPGILAYNSNSTTGDFSYQSRIIDFLSGFFHGFGEEFLDIGGLASSGQIDIDSNTYNDITEPDKFFLFDGSEVMGSVVFGDLNRDGYEDFLAGQNLNGIAQLNF